VVWMTTGRGARGVATAMSRKLHSAANQRASEDGGGRRRRAPGMTGECNGSRRRLIDGAAKRAQATEAQHVFYRRKREAVGSSRR